MSWSGPSRPAGDVRSSSPLRRRMTMHDATASRLGPIALLLLTAAPPAATVRQAAAAPPPLTPAPTQAPTPSVVAPEQVTFDEAVKRAMDRNPTVLAAATDILRAEGLLKQARAVTLPA